MKSDNGRLASILVGSQRDSDSTLEGCGLREPGLTRGRKQDKSWRREAHSPYATRLGNSSLLGGAISRASVGAFCVSGM